VLENLDRKLIEAECMLDGSKEKVNGQQAVGRRQQ